MSMLTAQDRSLIESLRKDIQWFKHEVAKSKDLLPTKKRVWGSYQDACEILAKSKVWYQAQRNGLEKLGVTVPTLIKGTDWRQIGNMIEYNLESIEQLKQKLIK